MRIKVNRKFRNLNTTCSTCSIIVSRTTTCTFAVAIKSRFHHFTAQKLLVLILLELSSRAEALSCEHENFPCSSNSAMHISGAPFVSEKSFRWSGSYHDYYIAMRTLLTSAYKVRQDGALQEEDVKYIALRSTTRHVPSNESFVLNLHSLSRFLMRRNNLFMQIYNPQ